MHRIKRLPIESKPLARVMETSYSVGKIVLAPTPRPQTAGEVTFPGPSQAHTNNNNNNNNNDDNDNTYNFI
jgi:hypothetical protein